MVTSGIEQLVKARYRILLQEMETEQRIRKTRADRLGCAHLRWVSRG